MFCLSLRLCFFISASDTTLISPGSVGAISSLSASKWATSFCPENITWEDPWDIHWKRTLTKEIHITPDKSAEKKTKKSRYFPFHWGLFIDKRSFMCPVELTLESSGNWEKEEWTVQNLVQNNKRRSVCSSVLYLEKRDGSIDRYCSEHQFTSLRRVCVTHVSETEKRLLLVVKTLFINCQ